MDAVLSAVNIATHNDDNIIGGFLLGGAVTIRLIRAILDEYLRLNPSLETVDDVIKSLIADGFITEDIIRQCKIAANLLDTGDLHVVLENRLNMGTPCRDFAERIAAKINNPSDSAADAIPQVSCEV